MMVRYGVDFSRVRQLDALPDPVSRATLPSEMAYRL